jgi:hypothetical protein
MKIQTTYQSCGGEGTPHCGNPPRMSALPVGTFRTEIVQPGAKYHLPVPPSLIITLTACGWTRSDGLVARGTGAFMDRVA